MIIINYMQIYSKVILNNFHMLFNPFINICVIYIYCRRLKAPIAYLFNTSFISFDTVALLPYANINLYTFKRI